MNKTLQRLTLSIAGLSLAAHVRAEVELTESLVLVGGESRVIESGRYGSIDGDGTVIARGDFAYGSIAPTVNLIVEDGVKVSNLYADDAFAQSILEKSALWLDASQESSMVEYNYNGYTVPEGTFPGIVVRRWTDCRKRELSDDYNYALNAREDGFIRVMPYTVTNALNGLTVVSFGTYPGTHLNNNDPRNQIDSSGKPTGNGYNEQRRLIFSKPVSCATAIMVFGSQNAGPANAPVGGGTALLGGWTQSTNSESKNASAAGETVEMVGNTAAPFPRNSTAAKILDENIPCWVDGVQVNPKEADLNGSYQIISLSPETARDVRSLGMKDAGSNAGGQIYGEILIFTNKLVSSERVAVERYLAKKWGLVNTQRTALPKSLTLGVGSRFESDGVGSLTPVGSGVLQIGGHVTGEGAYAGSVELASGGTLELKAPVKGWTQAQVAAVENRVGWFDPDCAEDRSARTKQEGGDRVYVDALFDHGKKDVEGTPYLHGYYRDYDNNDRRPVLWSRPVLGTDETRQWMDFYTDPGDKATPNGNNLRMQTNHKKAVGSESEVAPLACKTAFIVMDSCYGGCSPIIDNVSGNGKNQPQTDGSTLVRPRVYGDYHSPIWGSGTTAALTEGETRLNGKRVDGTKTGFTGGPELFSFTTDGTDFRASYFANFNARGNNTGSYAVLGEILLYSTVLDDATRSGIESYLMEKWLGKADWTQTKVSGSGTVKATGPAAVPTFENDFSGVLEMNADTLAFELDGVTKTVDHPISVPSTLKLAPEGTIVLSFKNGNISAGKYTLATFGELAEPGIEAWKVADLKPTYWTHLRLEANMLKVDVLSKGTSIVIR